MTTRRPRTNKGDAHILDEMVTSVMAGATARESFVSQAQRFLDGDEDRQAQTAVDTLTRKLSTPRWWREFIGADSLRPMTESTRSNVRAEMDVRGQEAVQSAVRKLKGLLRGKRRGVEADLVLCAHDVSAYTRPDDPAFHFTRLGTDLIGDLALAEQLCDAVDRVKDPQIVDDSFLFLVEHAEELLAGAKIMTVLTDRITGLTNAGS